MIKRLYHLLFKIIFLKKIQTVDYHKKDLKVKKRAQVNQKVEAEQAEIGTL